MKVPEVRRIIERHASMARTAISAEQFSKFADKVLQNPIPSDKFAAFAQPIFGSFGIRTGKDRTTVVERADRPRDVARALLARPPRPIVTGSPARTGRLQLYSGAAFGPNVPRGRGVRHRSSPRNAFERADGRHEDHRPALRLGQVPPGPRRVLRGHASRPGLIRVSRRSSAPSPVDARMSAAGMERSASKA